MKILIVHQYYLMPGHAGGSRFNEMARMWTQAGHEVTIIAGTLDYATGIVPERYQARWLTRERDGQVTVWRCYVPSTYFQSYIGRMWAFLGFTLSSATAAFRAPTPDVVIATSPPLVTAIPGWIVARLRARFVPWVFEIRDLWPESAVTTGVLREKSLLTRLLYRLEAWACRSSNRVSVLTPAFSDDLLRRRLVGRDKLIFAPNGVDTDVFTPGPPDPAVRKRLGWEGRFVVLYAGAHGRANAIGQLVDAAERLRDRPEILIACVGDGPERARWSDEARRRGLSNIVFHGAQPKEDMPGITRACDVCAAVLQDNPTFRTVYPNKVFESLACARPVLLAIDGVARQLVCDTAKAGVFVKSEDPNALAAAIRKLADDPAGRVEMGMRGVRWVKDNAGRDLLAARYLKDLEDLCAGARSSTSSSGKGRDPLLKKALDFGIALAAFVLLSPVFLVIALIVWLTMGRPIIFRQERPGLHGKTFRLVKFRTMKEGDGADAARLTPVGAFLRSTSLDELPELWNVMRGEMSLVGPRPLLTRYLDRYTREQARRHEVKPGITGWAQVNGRNALSWDDKFRYDVWYVDNQSLTLDLKILLMTLESVIWRTGITHEGEATMSEFLGSKGGDVR